MEGNTLVDADFLTPNKCVFSVASKKSFTFGCFIRFKKGALQKGEDSKKGDNAVNKNGSKTYIFDFSGDIYGAQISIALVEYLRPELSFDSVEALVEQMDSDCENAKKILSTS